MSIFDYEDNEALGTVDAVDTTSVSIRVEDLESLKRLQVNRLTVLQSSRAGQHLIGLVTRITRKADEAPLPEEDAADPYLVPQTNQVLAQRASQIVGNKAPEFIDGDMFVLIFQEMSGKIPRTAALIADQDHGGAPPSYPSAYIRA